MRSGILRIVWLCNPEGHLIAGILWNRESRIFGLEILNILRKKSRMHGGHLVVRWWYVRVSKILGSRVLLSLKLCTHDGHLVCRCGWCIESRISRVGVLLRV
jgi:hypothetical protein